MKINLLFLLCILIFKVSFSASTLLATQAPFETPGNQVQAQKRNPPAGGSGLDNENLKLTAEERAFIEIHPVIRAHNEQNWIPFNFYRDGKPQGYTIDIMNLVAKKLGIKFEYISGPTWDDFMGMLNSKDIDVIGNMVENEERRHFAAFTTPIIKNPLNIISQATQPFRNLEELEGYRVAIVKGFWYQALLETHAPGIPLLLVDSSVDALKAVAFGEADATIDIGAVMQHLMLEYNIPNLIISGETQIPGGENFYNCIGVRKDWGLLVTALNKALKAITYQEEQQLKQKWFGLQTIVPPERITLSKVEKKYLEMNPKASIAVMSDYAPFSFEENGELKGFVKELLALISEKTGVEFEEKVDHWNTNLNRFKNKKVDVITDISYKRERLPFTRYTTPYYEIPVVVFVRDDFENYTNLESLKGKKVGLQRGIFYAKELSGIDGITLVMFDNYEDQSKALAYGKIDALIQNLSVINYQVRKYGLSNIQVAGEFELKGVAKEDLRLGVTPEKPLLFSILQKGLDAISEDEFSIIANRWLSADFMIKNLHETKLVLSLAEENYLASRTEILMGVNPDWMPYESINKKGIHEGMTAEFMNIIGKRIGKDIQLVPTKDFSETLDNLKQRRCDILSLVQETPERRKYLNFTDSYLKTPVVIATRSDQLFIDDISKILTKKFTGIKDFAYIENLKKKYPGISILEVEDVEEGIEKVRSGEAFGFICSMPAIAYKIQHLQLVDVKITGKFDLSHNLSIAVRNDDPHLLSIMEKAVAALTEEERLNIYNKWVSIVFEKAFDYALLWRILGFFSVLLIGVFFWNRRLTALNRAIQKANMAKSEFLANMSHEIRTPMNAIIGLSELASYQYMSPKLRDYFEKIHSSGNLLLGVINGILDFSKIEAGKLDLENIDFSLSEVLNSVSNTFYFQTAEKGLEMIIAIEPDVPVYLQGDPLRTGQIFINLINNAIKFTDQGSITIRVAPLKKNGDLVRLLFSVSDTGIGIPEERGARLFEPFAQVDGSTSRKHGGTGLGLSICKQLVEKMNGRIWVESGIDRGSVFSFEAEFGVQTSGKEDCPAAPVDLAGLHVLVIDDNPVTRKAIEKMLTVLRFNVTAMESGENALMLLKTSENNNPVRVVITDWQMKGMDGFEICDKIREDSVLAGIPIILMSAYDQEGFLLQKSKDVGLDAFLLKPVTPSSLLETIMMVLRGENKRSSSIQKANMVDSATFKLLGGAKVLIVDDNEINRQVATEFLENAALIVRSVTNGQEAVDAVRKDQYDAVLMDVQMPEVDGYEATQIIREWEEIQNGGTTEQNRKCVPIIAMTAHAMEGEKENCLAAGMNDYVTKPIDTNQLFGVLSKWIEPLDRNVVIETPDFMDDEIHIPEHIPGIDVSTGLERVSGNSKLYKELLIKFIKVYSLSHQEIRSAWKRNEIVEATQLTHAYKGASGTIGARKLYSLTSELEQVLQQGDELVIEELLKSVEQEVKIIGESMSVLTGNDMDSVEKQGSESFSGAPLDMSIAGPIIRQLAICLQENDSDAMDSIVMLKSKMSPENKQLFRPIEELVNDLQFEKAYAELKVVCEKLSLRI